MCDSVTPDFAQLILTLIYTKYETEVLSTFNSVLVINDSNNFEYIFDYKRVKELPGCFLGRILENSNTSGVLTIWSRLASVSSTWFFDVLTKREARNVTHLES